MLPFPMPHFFVAQFFVAQCSGFPLFRRPFSVPFSDAVVTFYRYSYLFSIYIAVIRLVALCTVAHFFRCPNFPLPFFRGYTDVAFFLCRIFSLLNFPISQFFVAFLSCLFHWSFYFYLCCYISSTSQLYGLLPYSPLPIS